MAEGYAGGFQEEGGEVMKYLFDMPKPDRSKMPFAIGLSPEVDQWAKANKRRIYTHFFRGDEYPWSAFVGDIEMMGDVCRLVDDYELIAYGKTKGEAVQKLYENLKRQGNSIEGALKFLLGYIAEPEASRYAEQFGLKNENEANK